MNKLHYTINIGDPLSHYFEVSLRFTPDNSNNDLTDVLYLPNWIPGSYMIRDFAKHIVDLSASDQNGKLTITPISKSQFKLQHNGLPIDVSYKVYAFDLSVRKAYLDQQFGFLNTTSACLAVKGFEKNECIIDLKAPEHSALENWKPATGLRKDDSTSNFSWGRYYANDYLALTDYPILFGELDIATFDVEKVPHHMVTAGQHFGSLNRVVKDLKPLCEFHLNMFGEFPNDVEEYFFLTMITDKGFGGLEHTNSTALVASRFDILPEATPINDDYQTFLSLCSHEYLHTWNVKQLKPREFIPYLLDKEVYTQQLWFYEGMTSFLDDFSLLKTKTINSEKYLDVLAKTLTRVERGLGQKRQSVTESSFLTWTKFYQQDHTAPDQITSYYQKGALIACFADLAIRSQSNNEQCLQDLMNAAWTKYGVTGLGTTQSELESLFQAFLSESDFLQFKAFLHEPCKMSMVEILNRFGVELTFVSQDTQSQWTGNKGEPKNAFWLGATLAKVDNQIVVKQLLENSPAKKAGVAVGDTLVAFNNMKITSENIEEFLSRAAQNENLSQNQKPKNVLHYFRKDQLLTSTISLEASPKFVAKLAVTDQSKVDQWLS